MTNKLIAELELKIHLLESSLEAAMVIEAETRHQNKKLKERVLKLISERKVLRERLRKKKVD